MARRWDSDSDQPAMIHNKAYKRRIYKAAAGDFFKMLGTNLVIFPLASLLYLLSPAKKLKIENKHFFGMSINLDKNLEETRALVDELEVETLLIRMPLHDIENIAAYVEFAQQYADKDLVINILQDRRHVKNRCLLKSSLVQIFEQFSPLTSRFQIGNAINRKKWAIYSMDEYLRFYRVAFELKQQRFPQITLLGSSVIDFEYYFTIRTLFNYYTLRFDQLSSLLYVDRRGAPENTQAGLGVVKKLHLLQAIARLSPKASKEIVITEANWPIENTYPYAPTSEHECVSLEDYANYMVRYYLLVRSSNTVKNVYWHQLIAPGYGLIDNREGLKKYPAYYAFKTMLSVLKDSQFIALAETEGLYHAQFSTDHTHINVYWAYKSTTRITLNIQGKTTLQRDGTAVRQDEVIVGESPFYVIEKTS